MKDADVSIRISMLRFLMIFGVVIVHTPPTLEVHELDSSLWAHFISILQNGIFRAGVPVLTVISGFLLFGSNADLKYLDLLKKKANSLLLPFIIFNFGHVALQFAVYLGTGRWLGEDLFEQSFDYWMNTLFALRGLPSNDPLHFLRELLVLVILSPILGLLIRRLPVVGLVGVSLLFLTNSEGFLINRSDMPVAFYIGGLAAVYKWNLKALDKFWYISLLCYLAACAAITIFEIRSFIWLRLIAPVLVWSAVAPLVNTRLGKLMAQLSVYSFFLYLAHGPVMSLIWKVFEKALPSVPTPAFTAVAPFAVTLIGILVYEGLNTVAPRQFNWVLGNRAKKAKMKNHAVGKESTGSAVLAEVKDELEIVVNPTYQNIKG